MVITLMPKIDISKEWLEEHYVNKGLSTCKCAELIGCNYVTVWNRLREYDIPVRSRSEAIKGKRLGKNHPMFGMTGDKSPWFGRKHSAETKQKISEIRTKLGLSSGYNNPNWKGGVSFEQYCPKFNKHLKEEIREKFGRTCFICGKHEGHELLSVHHVDYNKGQGCGSKWALVPLCRSCHAKTSHNRWHWFGLLGNYWAMNSEIQFVYNGV